MKKILLLILVVSAFSMNAQNTYNGYRFYLGASYGNNYPLGDFKDTDLNNKDAGFAKRGKKIDIYGGYNLNDNIILTAVYRNQKFDADIEGVLGNLEANNAGKSFTGTAENWNIDYGLIGAAYRVPLSPKFNIYPRAAIGPMFISNPSFNIRSNDNSINVARGSESTVGLGYEFGVSLIRNIGRHFILFPSFTFSGGFANISDVTTTTNGGPQTQDIKPKVFTFNLGFSLGYRF